MQMNKRGQTSDKLQTKQSRKFNVENVTIDGQTGQPLLLTPYSHSGMRKLSRQQRQLYDQHTKQLKSGKLQNQQLIKNQYQIAKYPISQKEREKQRGREKANSIKSVSYKTGQKQQQKKIEIDIKNLSQKDELNNLLHKKLSSKQKGKFMKQQKEEPKTIQVNEADKMKDSMELSALNMVQKLAQQQNNTEMPNIKYLNAKFNQLHTKHQKTQNMLQLIFQKLQFKQQEKRSLILINDEKQKNELDELKKKNAFYQAEHKQSKAYQKTLIQDIRQLDRRNQQLLATKKLLVSQITEKDFLLKERDAQLKQLQSQFQQIKSKKQKQATMMKQVTENKDSIEKLKFYSNLTVENNISSFMRQSIESFTKRKIKRAKLTFKKDEVNANITYYLAKPPFPLVMLFNTFSNTIFGAFTQGIWTNKSNINLQDSTFKTFLFNATTKTIINNNVGSPIKCGLVYNDNYLTFGNSELRMKNQTNLIKVNANFIFGQRYYDIPKRQILTGEESDEVQINILPVMITDRYRHLSQQISKYQISPQQTEEKKERSSGCINEQSMKCDAR